MDSGICQSCINNEFLKKEVMGHVEDIVCTECGKDASGLSIGHLGRRLEPLLRRYYVDAAWSRPPSDSDDDCGHLTKYGDRLTDIVEEGLGARYKCHSEIIEAVKEAEMEGSFDPGEVFWDDCAEYEFKLEREDYETFPGWYITKAELKHGRRFFSPAASRMFDALFKDIDEIRASSEQGPEPVCYQMEVGEKLFRARVLDSDRYAHSFVESPAKNVGPPPSANARGGRMNAEGISALYASRRKGTCIAEMRPAIGSTLAVIQLVTQRPLRVLDFGRLERALCAISMFDPQYSDQRARLATLRELHRLVSEPVVPGGESDYLITQTMAEYLAHVYEKPFDGVVFRSAQDGEGENVVLFSRDVPFDGDLPGRFGVDYVEDSLGFVRTRAVKVTSDDLMYAVLGGTTYLLMRRPSSQR